MLLLLLILLLADYGADKWRGKLPRWLASLHHEFRHEIKFVLANPAKTADFLRVFGLSAADAPTVVIHDTARDGKHKLPEQMSKASVRRFVLRFLGRPAPAAKPRAARTAKPKDEV